MDMLIETWMFKRVRINSFKKVVFLGMPVLIFHNLASVMCPPHNKRLKLTLKLTKTKVKLLKTFSSNKS